MQSGLSSSVSLPWDDEEGQWSVGSSLGMTCSCGGTFTGGNNSTSFSANLPHDPNPAKLQQCNTACDQGRTQIENYCRSIPAVGPWRFARAACWGVTLAGAVPCKGLCYALYGNW